MSETPALLCPACDRTLGHHPAGPHIDAWVQMLFYPQANPFCAPHYSTSFHYAWELMNKVWELDPYACITKNTIDIHIDEEGWNKAMYVVTGPTFPVRVCRAAICLASEQKGDK